MNGFHVHHAGDGRNYASYQCKLMIISKYTDISYCPTCSCSRARSVETALSSRSRSSGGVVLPRVPSKTARQTSLGSQSKARRHEESRSRRSESDLVAEIGRFREEQRGNIFIALYKHITLDYCNERTYLTKLITSSWSLACMVILHSTVICKLCRICRSLLLLTYLNLKGFGLCYCFVPQDWVWRELRSCVR